MPSGSDGGELAFGTSRAIIAQVSGIVGRIDSQTPGASQAPGAFQAPGALHGSDLPCPACHKSPSGGVYNVRSDREEELEPAGHA
ncbi:MAG: hypothetical protein A2Z37_15990 [Chloroflexi bacterium RBG_19FT_COMBO_62_14]|nr:MAG: hypothetical protein A2Z37_15990 [Chloroflexi bacterium RBG_19FT_COMBO_62_14]